MRELLDDLMSRFPGLRAQLVEDDDIAPFVNVYVEGEDVRTLDGLDTPVGDGSTVILLPAMAGGCSKPASSQSSLLDLVGNTPLVELPRLRRRRRSASTRSSRAQNPTGSIKDRVAKAMIEAAEASGELEPGRELLEPTSGNTGISLALVAKLKGYPLTCVMPDNATEERRRLLELYGATIVDSPGDQGSNGAVRLALELAEREPRYFMPFQYANEANPRAHYEGTGAEIAEALDRVDVLVAGLGTGGTLMGTGDAAARELPRRRRRRRRAAARRPRDGPALARGRLRAADPRRLEARPEGARLERGVGARACARCSTARASSPASPPARSCTSRGSSPTSSTRASSSACSPTAAGSTCRADFWERRRRRDVDGDARSGGDPAPPCASARRARAGGGAERSVRALVLRDGVAERYERGRNARRVAVPLRARRRPELWFLEDDGYELAVFHSHLSSPPAPVAHRRREHRPLGGQALPHLLAARGRARRLDDPATARSPRRCRQRS